MKVLNKIFGEIKMTWPKLIAFSIAIGVVVGVIMIIPALKDNAIRMIGVGYEMWFILAIFVIVNCKNTLDAGLKCFVFFLISQPLIYLVQQPFASVNLIQAYYYPWFIKTLFTFPGAMIAYQIKRKDMLGTLILSVAGLALGVFGAESIVSGITRSGISYVIYGIVQWAAVIIFGLLYCPGKKLKAIYGGIVVLAIVVFFILIGNKSFTHGSYDYSIAEGSTWTMLVGSNVNSSLDIEGNVLHIEYSSSDASGDMLCENEKGEVYRFEFKLVNGKPVVEIEKQE